MPGRRRHPVQLFVVPTPPSRLSASPSGLPQFDPCPTFPSPARHPRRTLTAPSAHPHRTLAAPSRPPFSPPRLPGAPQNRNRWAHRSPAASADGRRPPRPSLIRARQCQMAPPLSTHRAAQTTPNRALITRPIGRSSLAPVVQDDRRPLLTCRALPLDLHLPSLLTDRRRQSLHRRPPPRPRSVPQTAGSASGA